MFALSLQGMSNTTFKSILEGKQSNFEEKINVDAGLLSKLQQCGIITSLQRSAIEVISVIVYMF